MRGRGSNLCLQFNLVPKTKSTRQSLWWQTIDVTKSFCKLGMSCIHSKRAMSWRNQSEPPTLQFMLFNWKLQQTGKFPLVFLHRWVTANDHNPMLSLICVAVFFLPGKKSRDFSFDCIWRLICLFEQFGDNLQQVGLCPSLHQLHNQN